MNLKKKYVVIVAAVLIQLCVGVGNLWSIFQEGVATTIFNGDNAGASLSFSLLLAMLGIGGILGGKIEEKYSTRVTIVSGGLLLGIGFIGAGFVTDENPWMIWITYGLIGGMGSGFCYSPSISCAQKWFPAKKGLITGVIVAALGSSGIIFTPLIEVLISTFGGVAVGESSTFVTLGIVFLVVVCLAGMFMRTPSQEEAVILNSEVVEVKSKANTSKKSIINKSPKEMLATKEFYMLIVTFMLSCMGGLMLLGFAKPIAVAKGLGETAVIGVLLISIFNALGRLFWGTVSDKIGRINTITVIIIGSGVFALLIPFAPGYSIYAVIAAVGFFYGGLLSSFPPLTADLFGPQHMAINYGIVLIGFGISAIVSSQIAGYYKNLASENIDLMTPAFLIAGGSAAVALILIRILKKKTEV